MKYFTCSDFGHIVIECTNNKKTVGRSFKVTLSDTNRKQENASKLEDGETIYHAFIANIDPHSNDIGSSSNEEDKGVNSYLLAKFNPSSFDELFLGFLGARKERDRLFIEVIKLNDMITFNK